MADSTGHPAVSVDALEKTGLANIAHYPIIHITNAALSRMLMSGDGARGREPPVAQTPTDGAILDEVRSVGQKSRGPARRTCS